LLHWILGVTLFVLAYLLNMVYITVFYHRAFAHGAVTLKPGVRAFAVATGNWVTGLDPKAWACMHRRHHLYSDTEKDPHSPANGGVISVLWSQLFSYQTTLTALMVGRREYMSVVEDLDFEVSVLNRKKLWFLPYVLHTAIAVALGLATANPWIGAAYYAGIMSHPVEGWLVNAFGHAVGYRNFDTPDQSTNNFLVALAVMGEGYQNNHHQNPGAANFGVKWWEVDFGYTAVRVMQTLGLLTGPVPRELPEVVEAA
jgi:stearoyl-CoA desaturase (delta-9 desaturase)